MTAYNVVRMKVKPGREKEFLDKNRQTAPGELAKMKQNGLKQMLVVKTGERTYCIIGEWDKFDSIVKSRPEMIKSLDGMRDLLEDLGHGLGVTDPVSGEVVVEVK